MTSGIRAKIRRKMVRENSIYIMPTGRGMLFLCGMLVMILTAATYNNNLIFILAFFMTSLFIVSMLQTHFNLKSVRLRFVSADDAFAGEKLTLLLQLFQKRKGHKYALRIRSYNSKWKTLEIARGRLTPTETSKPVRLALVAWKRGVHPVPELIVETYFPLGLFRAWKVFRPEGKLVVYPSPQGQRELEVKSFALGEDELGLRTSPEGDFGELKTYRDGESYHQIAWKHYARTGVLYSKVHWGEDHKFYHIPWEPRGTDFESYLRQMSRWVQVAVEENAAFDMELPGQIVDAGSGRDQGKTCWRLLAGLKESA